MEFHAFTTASPDRYELLKEWAVSNRQNPTMAEDYIWEHIRAGKLGVRFRRQHAIGDYIVDFVCLKKKLIIEIDGGYHSNGEQKEEDAIRSNDLTRWGFSIIRFTNEQVLYDTEKTIQEIQDKLSLSPLGERVPEGRERGL